jgi:adenosylmethionine-8-amino-7-oxononanoate aminotransferase
MFAAQRFGVDADMITFAKGVTSGYAPLGGVLVAPRLWEPFYVDSPTTPVFRHGATYAGHATAAAVALANLDLLERDRLVPRVRELEAVLQTELAGLDQRQEAVVDVRVGGFLGGVTLDERIPAERVADRLIELGFISRPLRGNTLQLSPPYIVTNQEVGDYVAAIEQAVAEEAQQ